MRTLILLLLAGAASAAEVYQCPTADGSLSLSDKPCGPAVSVEVQDRAGVDFGSGLVQLPPVLKVAKPVPQSVPAPVVIVQQAPEQLTQPLHPIPVTVIDERRQGAARVDAYYGRKR